MVVKHLGPVVDDVDVRLGSDPGNRGGVADQSAAESSIDGDAYLPRSEGLSRNVDARNIKRGRIRIAVVARLRIVAQVGHAEPNLGKESRRKHPVVVQPGAVGLLIARAFKTATRRTTQKRSKRRSLEGKNPLEAVAPAQMVLFVHREVDLGVEAVGRLRERQRRKVVIGRIDNGSVPIQCSVRRRSGVDLLQNGK